MSRNLSIKSGYASQTSNLFSLKGEPVVGMLRACDRGLHRRDNIRVPDVLSSQESHRLPKVSFWPSPRRGVDRATQIRRHNNETYRSNDHYGVSHDVGTTTLIATSVTAHHSQLQLLRDSQHYRGKSSHSQYASLAATEELQYVAAPETLFIAFFNFLLSKRE